MINLTRAFTVEKAIWTAEFAMYSIL